eukprot:scaffold132_cov59-Cylindrotheca_fusiformis.AAC.9
MPKTFREAWDHPDSLMRDRWRAAIQKEFNDMNKRQVWRVIEKVKVPKNRRLVKCKWVFDVKRRCGRKEGAFR